MGPEGTPQGSVAPAAPLDTPQDGVLDGWQMMQDEDWPAGVSEAMRTVAVSADEFAAGSAASKGYSDDDRLLWVAAVCFVREEVVAHFVNCQTDEQWWGTRARASLHAGEEG